MSQIRGARVILDSDLAALYGVTTKRLNEQFKRNRKRFPEDFAFQLTVEEADSLRSQFATSSSGDAPLRSQSATLKTGRGQHRKYRPYAFTEHGALQAANVLNSPRAVQMSVFVVRAFLKMRALLGDKRELAKQLAALEKELKQRLDVHEAAIVTVLQRVMDIIDPPFVPAPAKPRIGFTPDPPTDGFAVANGPSDPPLFAWRTNSPWRGRTGRGEANCPPIRQRSHQTNPPWRTSRIPHLATACHAVVPRLRDEGGSPASWPNDLRIHEDASDSSQAHLPGIADIRAIVLHRAFVRIIECVRPGAVVRVSKVPINVATHMLQARDLGSLNRLENKML